MLRVALYCEGAGESGGSGYGLSIGDLLEALPRDLAGAARRSDDPLTPDTGPAVAPALDLGAFERVP